MTNSIGKVELDNGIDEINDILKFRSEDNGVGFKVDLEEKTNDINIGISEPMEEDEVEEIDDVFENISRGSITRPNEISLDSRDIFGEIEEEDSKEESDPIEINIPYNDIEAEVVEVVESEDIDLRDIVSTIGIVEDVETQEDEEDREMQLFEDVLEDEDDMMISMNVKEAVTSKIEFQGLEDSSSVNEKLERAFSMNNEETNVEVMNTKIIQFKLQRENEAKFMENLRDTGSIVFKINTKDTSVPKGYTYIKEFNSLVLYGKIPSDLVKARNTFVNKKKSEIMDLIMKAIETDYQVIEVNVPLKENGVVAFNPTELKELHDYILSISGTDTKIQFKNGEFRIEI